MKIIIKQNGIKLDIAIEYSNDNIGNIEPTIADLKKAIDILEQVEFNLRAKIRDLS